MSNVLIKPIITERSMMDASHGRFTFQVDLSANKSQIAAEVAAVFNVHPVDVHTMIVKGTSKRSLKARKLIKGANFKKAVVMLKAGEKIGLFDITEQQTK